LNFIKGDYLVEKIRDSAGQKGTGKWTAIAALDYGVPVTLIGEAVFARCLSSLQAERIEASKVLPAPAFKAYSGERASFIEAIRKVSINFYFCFFFIFTVCNKLFHFVSFQALYASKIVSYAQGFMLLREAAKQYDWTLNYGGIALMWRGGCIIRRWENENHNLRN
jgi:6-phosphogluconate dehydrogenase